MEPKFSGTGLHVQEDAPNQSDQINSKTDLQTMKDMADVITARVLPIGRRRRRRRRSAFAAVGYIIKT